MRPILCILLIAALAYTASAIGIAPATTELSYAPEQNITFRIYGEGTVRLDVNGSLAPYIKLDKDLLLFANDSVLTVVATVRIPKDMDKALSADVNAIGDMRVSARMSLRSGIVVPTGSVVTDVNLENSHWVSLALLLLVVGNVVYFTVAKSRRKTTIDLRRIKTIAELAHTIRGMGDSVFRKYVNDEKNEFADWLGEHDYPELAYRLYDITDKQATVKTLEGYEPMQSGPAQEILELKHELDTYDFKGFDKIYK